MRITLAFVSCAALLLFTGCGKFFDKFSRLDSGFTRVNLQSNGDPTATTLSGGFMIYFVRQDVQNTGKVFGFPSEVEANSRTVVLPNGLYRVYAFGFDGSNKLEGQARCGYGNQGTLVALNGSPASVDIALNMTSCGFGADSPFSFVDGANGSNFDQLLISFCNDNAVTCGSPNAMSGSGIQLRALAGDKMGSNAFGINGADSLTSICSPISSGTATTNIKLPLGGLMFSPPVQVLIFSSSTCAASSSVATLTFPDGLKSYLGVATGSSFFLSSPISSSYSTLKIQYP